MFEYTVLKTHYVSGQKAQKSYQVGMYCKLEMSLIKKLLGVKYAKPDCT